MFEDTPPKGRAIAAARNTDKIMGTDRAAIISGKVAIKQGKQ
jgi:hypothetical protein